MKSIKNKIIVIFILIITTFSVTVSAGTVRSKVRGITSYPDSVHRAVDLINCLPEARDLLKQVEQEGNIKIEFSKGSTEMEAYWLGGSRTILLNPKSNKTVGQQINSILFELINASTMTQMERQANLAYNGALSKSEYIEAIERIEHANGLKASKLLKLGIDKKLFPKDAAFSIQTCFEEYLSFQKKSGHSDFIAKDFNRIAPHRSRERDDASHYMAIKRDLESHDRERIVSATLKLHQEFKQIESEKKPNVRRKQLFHQTFTGNPIFDALKGAP